MAVVVALAVVCAGGCAEQVRFTSVEAHRLEVDGELTAVAFVSTFRTVGLADRQLVYQATLIDKDGQPITSRNRRFQTADGSVAASRTFVVHKSPQVCENFRIVIPADELEAQPHHAPVSAIISVYPPGSAPITAARCDVPIYRAKAAEAPPEAEQTALAAAPVPKPSPAKTSARQPTKSKPAPAPAKAPPAEPAKPDAADTPTATAAEPKEPLPQRGSYWFMKPLDADSSPILVGPFDSAKAALERSPDSAHKPKVLSAADEVWVVQLKGIDGANGARFVGPCLSKPEAARAADLLIANHKARDRTVTVAGFARMRLDAWLALENKVASKSP
ncbi:MAG: hypothetical protein ACYS8X_08230 [Planctomycetota bacterium]|jgi:hypothetical protein